MEGIEEGKVAKHCGLLKEVVGHQSVPLHRDLERSFVVNPTEVSPIVQSSWQGEQCS